MDKSVSTDSGPNDSRRPRAGGLFFFFFFFRLILSSFLHGQRRHLAKLHGTTYPAEKASYGNLVFHALFFTARLERK